QDVRFIATSATIGKAGDPKANAKLQEYLADIAGLPPERVHVIEGGREVPELTPELEGRDEPLPTATELASVAPDARYQRLASVKSVRRLRTMLAERGAMRLSELASSLHETKTPTPSEIQEALTTLDLARTG